MSWFSFSSIQPGLMVVSCESSVSLNKAFSSNWPTKLSKKIMSRRKTGRLSDFSYVIGFYGMIVSYAHYYSHHGRVLLTHICATSMNATTVGDGDNPRGSTELDDKSGNNCHITLHTLSLNLIVPMEAWAQAAKDTSSAITPLSTCSLLTLPRSPTSTR